MAGGVRPLDRRTHGRPGAPVLPLPLKPLHASRLTYIRERAGLGRREARTQMPSQVVSHGEARKLAPAFCEHSFVTSQGSAYGRLRRALDTGNATIALAAATELDFVSLPEALELVLLVVDDPRRFRRAALRWHARYCADVPDVGFEEAHAVLVCLAGLTGRRPKAAGKRRLPSSFTRGGLERASKALIRRAG